MYYANLAANFSVFFWRSSSQRDESLQVHIYKLFTYNMLAIATSSKLQLLGYLFVFALFFLRWQLPQLLQHVLPVMDDTEMSQLIGYW